MPEGPAKSIIALAAALPVELSGLKDLGRFKKEGLCRKEGRVHIEYLRGDVHGVDVALFVSGVGEQRAYETAKKVCAALPLTAYISVGLSGALKAGLRAGDIVVGESTTILPSPPAGEGRVGVGKGSADETYESDRKLLMTARDALTGSAHCHFGPLLASPRVAVTSAEKKALALASNCIALDMESSGAARAAHEAGVPFIAIRAISDTLDYTLPVDFNNFMKGGGLDMPRFILHVLTHPFVIPGLMRLGRDSRMAARNLAGAVDRVISEVMMTATRAKTLSMLEDYLGGRIGREVIQKWADDIVISKEWDELITKDKLLSESIQVLWELHHEGDEERFNPTTEEFEYYKNCLQGKIEFKK